MPYAITKAARLAILAGALIFQTALLTSTPAFRFADFFVIFLIFFSIIRLDNETRFFSLLGGLMHESLSVNFFGLGILPIILVMWLSRTSLSRFFTHRSLSSLFIFSFLAALSYNVMILISEGFDSLTPLGRTDFQAFILGTFFSAFFLFMLFAVSPKLLGRTYHF